MTVADGRLMNRGLQQEHNNAKRRLKHLLKGFKFSLFGRSSVEAPAVAKCQQGSSCYSVFRSQMTRVASLQIISVLIFRTIRRPLEHRQIPAGMVNHFKCDLQQRVRTIWTIVHRSKPFEVFWSRLLRAVNATPSIQIDMTARSSHSAVS